MKKVKTAEWVEDQNSYTFWYGCSNCGYGIFDGWECNQQKLKTCPECKALMTNGEVD